MAETGSIVENLRDGVRGFIHAQSPKEVRFHTRRVPDQR